MTIMDFITYITYIWCKKKTWLIKLKLWHCMQIFFTVHDMSMQHLANFPNCHNRLLPLIAVFLLWIQQFPDTFSKEVSPSWPDLLIFSELWGSITTIVPNFASPKLRKFSIFLFCPKYQYNPLSGLWWI